MNHTAMYLAVQHALNAPAWWRITDSFQELRG